MAATYAWQLASIQVIPTGSAAIVERFGKYSRTLFTGFNTITPLADTVRNRIDLREQTVPFPLYVISTYDGSAMPIELTIQYSVTDPVKATYSTASYIQALERHTLYELTYALSNLAAADARMSLQQVAGEVRQALEPRAARWGLTLHEVLLTLGTIEVTEHEDEAAVVADHGGASAQVYASHVVMNVSGQISNQANGGFESMSNWKIERQQISGGNIQQGDRNHQANYGQGGELGWQQARDVITTLLAELRMASQAGRLTAPSIIADAEVIEGELVAADAERREPDAGLMRQAWERMKTTAGPAAIAVAGTATADLIAQLGQLLGT
ncbi:SPFH domain-containing protein [Kitasatospora atroaurantiaca]|uniref:SPFH domain-containing protein n=1 Tax=Kitasatospora atroaurantiaca TaxID=285545 RepID=UPI00147951FE|nr:SPFH domain-containing protein [Kitasatospora atroaurantiaca]